MLLIYNYILANLIINSESIHNLDLKIKEHCESSIPYIKKIVLSLIKTNSKMKNEKYSNQAEKRSMLNSIDNVFKAFNELVVESYSKFVLKSKMEDKFAEVKLALLKFKDQENLDLFLNTLDEYVKEMSISE